MLHLEATRKKQSMTSRIKSSHIADRPKKKTTPAEEKSAEMILRKAEFKDLPPELKMDIFELLDNPADAIAVAQTNKSNRHLIGDLVKVWKQHGLNPPIDLPVTMQTAVTKRVKSMSHEAQVALSILKEPLDVFSDSAVKKFTAHIKSMNYSMLLAEATRSTGKYRAMLSCLETVVKHALKAGVKVPTLSPLLKSAVENALIEEMAVVELHAISEELWETEFVVKRIEICAELAGVEMLPLSASVKAACIQNIEPDIRRARRYAQLGDIPTMNSYLSDAVANARRAGVRLPSMSMGNVTDEVKASYNAFVNLLEDATKPLPIDD